MGEGGAVWLPAPFLQFKESPPRGGDPHPEGGGDSAARAQESGRAQRAGHGPVLRWYNKARRTVLLSSPVSHVRGTRESRQHVPHLARWRVTKEPLFSRPLSK